MDLGRDWYRRAQAIKARRKLVDRDIAARLSQLLPETKSVERGAVNSWLHGTREPTVMQFLALCKVLGTNPAELLGQKKNEEWETSSKRHAATDRRYEPLTADEGLLLQQYRRLREIGSGDTLLRAARFLHEEAMRDRKGADVVPLMRKARPKRHP